MEQIPHCIVHTVKTIISRISCSYKLKLCRDVLAKPKNAELAELLELHKKYN